MNRDEIDQLFKSLRNGFDIEEPSKHHKQQFLIKLNKNNTDLLIKDNKKNWRFVKPLVGIAASFVLLIALYIGTNKNQATSDLASVSSKMAETQDFFTTTIAYELSKVEKKTTPETQALIRDTMRRLEALEIEYEALKKDLSKSGDDNRVIFAMISNFQNRIHLLQNTLEHIQNIKQLKHLDNETYTTL